MTCAATTAAGIASTASRPANEPTRAVVLLLDIRPACSRRADRAADHSSDRDQRQRVGQRLEERAPLVPVGVRQPVGERAREAEEQRGAVGRERTPLAEDE